MLDPQKPKLIGFADDEFGWGAAPFEQSAAISDHFGQTAEVHFGVGHAIQDLCEVLLDVAAATGPAVFGAG